jgi:predicted small secreted protein
MRQRRWIPLLVLSLAAALLTGCSTTRVVEGQVQSFSTLAAVPAPATYRIERLPSQQAPSFDAIATLAEQSLERAGLRRDDAAPRLLVQLGAQADTVPRNDPFGPSGPYSTGPRGFGGWYGRGWGVHGMWRFGEPTPLHRRAVSIVMRDASTQAVVYETSAVHEDVWVSDPAVYGVLFDAALNGFPKPPEGPRQVRLPLVPPSH